MDEIDNTGELNLSCTDGVGVMSLNADEVATDDSAVDFRICDDHSFMAAKDEAEILVDNGTPTDSDGKHPSDSEEQLESQQDADVHATDTSGQAFRGKTKHFYCPVCGHTWYSPGWPSYCPKSGCLGRPQEM